MSEIVLCGLHSPTSSCFAYAAAAAAFFLFGLHTPRTSPSRTPVQPSMWNFALKPEPMKPTPNGLEEGIARGGVGVRVRRSSSIAHAKLGERRGRAAVPCRQRDVPLVLHVLPSHLARKEATGGEVAKATEEDHAVTQLGLGTLRPSNVVEHAATLGIGGADE